MARIWTGRGVGAQDRAVRRRAARGSLPGSATYSVSHRSRDGMVGRDVERLEVQLARSRSPGPSKTSKPKAWKISRNHAPTVMQSGADDRSRIGRPGALMSSVSAAQPGPASLAACPARLDLARLDGGLRARGAHLVGQLPDASGRLPAVVRSSIRSASGRSVSASASRPQQLEASAAPTHGASASSAPSELGASGIGAAAAARCGSGGRSSVPRNHRGKRTTPLRFRSRAGVPASDDAG